MLDLLVLDNTQTACVLNNKMSLTYTHNRDMLRIHTISSYNLENIQLKTKDRRKAQKKLISTKTMDL